MNKKTISKLKRKIFTIVLVTTVFFIVAIGISSLIQKSLFYSVNKFITKIENELGIEIEIENFEGDYQNYIVLKNLKISTKDFIVNKELLTAKKLRVDFDIRDLLLNSNKKNNDDYSIIERLTEIKIKNLIDNIKKIEIDNFKVNIPSNYKDLKFLKGPSRFDWKKLSIKIVLNSGQLNLEDNKIINRALDEYIEKPIDIQNINSRIALKDGNIIADNGFNIDYLIKKKIKLKTRITSTIQYTNENLKINNILYRLSLFGYSFKNIPINLKYKNNKLKFDTYYISKHRIKNVSYNKYNRNNIDEWIELSGLYNIKKKSAKIDIPIKSNNNTIQKLYNKIIKNIPYKNIRKNLKSVGYDFLISKKHPLGKIQIILNKSGYFIKSLLKIANIFEKKDKLELRIKNDINNDFKIEYSYNSKSKNKLRGIFHLRNDLGYFKTKLLINRLNIPYYKTQGIFEIEKLTKNKYSLQAKKLSFLRNDNNKSLNIKLDKIYAGYEDKKLSHDINFIGSDIKNKRNIQFSLELPKKNHDKIYTEISWENISLVKIKQLLLNIPSMKSNIENIDIPENLYINGYSDAIISKKHPQRSIINGYIDCNSDINKGSTTYKKKLKLLNCKFKYHNKRLIFDRINYIPQRILSKGELSWFYNGFKGDFYIKRDKRKANISLLAKKLPSKNYNILLKLDYNKNHYEYDGLIQLISKNRISTKSKIKINNKNIKLDGEISKVKNTFRPDLLIQNGNQEFRIKGQFDYNIDNKIANSDIYLSYKNNHANIRGSLKFDKDSYKILYPDFYLKMNKKRIYVTGEIDASNKDLISSDLDLKYKNIPFQLKSKTNYKDPKQIKSKYRIFWDDKRINFIKGFLNYKPESFDINTILSIDDNRLIISGYIPHDFINNNIKLKVRLNEYNPIDIIGNGNFYHKNLHLNTLLKYKNKKFKITADFKEINKGYETNLIINKKIKITGYLGLTNSVLRTRFNHTLKIGTRKIKTDNELEGRFYFNKDNKKFNLTLIGLNHIDRINLGGRSYNADLHWKYQTNSNNKKDIVKIFNLSFRNNVPYTNTLIPMKTIPIESKLDLYGYLVYNNNNSIHLKLKDFENTIDVSSFYDIDWEILTDSTIIFNKFTPGKIANLLIGKIDGKLTLAGDYSNPQLKFENFNIENTVINYKENNQIKQKLVNISNFNLIKYDDDFILKNLELEFGDLHKSIDNKYSIIDLQKISMKDLTYDVAKYNIYIKKNTKKNKLKNKNERISIIKYLENLSSNGIYNLKEFKWEYGRLTAQSKDIKLKIRKKDDKQDRKTDTNTDIRLDNIFFEVKSNKSSITYLENSMNVDQFTFIFDNQCKLNFELDLKAKHNKTELKGCLKYDSQWDDKNGFVNLKLKDIKYKNNTQDDLLIQFKKNRNKWRLLPNDLKIIGEFLTKNDTIKWDFQNENYQQIGNNKNKFSFFGALTNINTIYKTQIHAFLSCKINKIKFPLYLVESLKEFNVDVNADLKIFGLASDPFFSGFILFDNLNLKHKSNFKINNGKLKLNFPKYKNEQKAQITNIEFLYNDGLIKGFGACKYKNWFITAISTILYTPEEDYIEIKEDINFINYKGKIKLTPVVFETNWHDYELKGIVELFDGDINLDLRKSSKGNRRFPIVIDNLVLKPGNDLRFSVSSKIFNLGPLSSELTLGDVTVKQFDPKKNIGKAIKRNDYKDLLAINGNLNKGKSKMLFFGQLSTKQGRINYFNNTFRIEKMYVIFRGELDPILYLKASVQTRDEKGQIVRITFEYDDILYNLKDINVLNYLESAQKNKIEIALLLGLPTDEIDSFTQETYAENTTSSKNIQKTAQAFQNLFIIKKIENFLSDVTGNMVGMFNIESKALGNYVERQISEDENSIYDDSTKTKEGIFNDTEIKLGFQFLDTNLYIQGGAVLQDDEFSEGLIVSPKLILDYDWDWTPYMPTFLMDMDIIDSVVGSAQAGGSLKRKKKDINDDSGYIFKPEFVIGGQISIVFW